ncbi:MAG: oligopeptide/dipeptide ABC transporter ATP-binding protein [Candidatus Omnitrophota bacterium]|jgi:oligopeptide/dipeptide ABC transporter ATP-binding protein
MQPLLSVEDVRKYFPVERGLARKLVGTVRAVDGISFKIEAGKTLGLVGESGCGKTTLSRILLNLLVPTGGKVVFDGVDITGLSSGRMRPLRKGLQAVFQDPYNSLDPRMKVGEILAEPLLVHRIGNAKERKERVSDLLSKVGLMPDHARRFPHQFSGGERQRIGIARALMTSPKLVICDEPVSSLDLSIQAQILELLRSVQEEFGLSYLFISHDLRVIEAVSDNVLVMYLGKAFEYASTAGLYSAPVHPYTEALFSAISLGPGRKTKRISVKGEPPSPISPPPGCKFHPRCPYAEPQCGVKEPSLEEVRPGHFVACPPRVLHFKRLSNII